MTKTNIVWWDECNTVSEDIVQALKLGENKTHADWVRKLNIKGDITKIIYNKLEKR